MKSGFAIVVGKCIDMVADGFTGRDGSDVKKLTVLVKPSDEATPIELEVWGELAEKFEAAEPVLGTFVIQASIIGREWEKNGQTYRRTALRIKEWAELSSSPLDIGQEAVDHPF